jgi:hypothetical protein
MRKETTEMARQTKRAANPSTVWRVRGRGRKLPALPWPSRDSKEGREIRARVKAVLAHKLVSSEQVRRSVPIPEVLQFLKLQVAAANVSEACKGWIEHHFVTGQDLSPPMPQMLYLLECSASVMAMFYEKIPQVARTAYGEPFVRNGKGDEAHSAVAARSAEKSEHDGAVRVGRARAKKAQRRVGSKKSGSSGRRRKK